MNATQLNPHFSRYLDELRQRAAALPPDQARDLVADIAEHLDAAQATVISEAEALAVLDRLGSPSEVVAAAQPAVSAGRGVGAQPSVPAGQGIAWQQPAPLPDGRREVLALVLLVLAELMAIIWPAGVVLAAAGAYLLFTSRVWSMPQKLAGLLTLVLAMPAVLLFGLAAFTTYETTCTSETAICESTGPASSWGPWLVGGYFVAQLATLVWLSLSLRRVRRG